MKKLSDQRQVGKNGKWGGGGGGGSHAYRETHVDTFYMRIPNETSVC